MLYKNVIEGYFVSRQNRFIAIVNINGNEEVCHVKNTGRLRELLLPNAKVVVALADNPNRKTKYDLIGVYKNDVLFNIDSQVVNKVFEEWISSSNYFKNIKLIKPEYKYKDSRLDFYIEADNKKHLIEVKGVTLEMDGIAKFPDAPTLRGIKHINTLVESSKDGFIPHIVFVIQFKGANSFEPNKETHPKFAEALLYSKQENVDIIALDCIVKNNSIVIDKFVSTNI
ncbi:MAG: DNA/RNA nuclease SfsA [Christensenellaceae bacterium]|nr:DNA/RNA nuclease SfsA [Christensenellaceae bacterium]